MAGRVSFAAFVAIMLLPPCWTSPADSSVWVGPSAVIREIEDARVYSDKQEILFLIPDLPDAPKLRVVPCRAQDNPICDLLIPMNKAVVGVSQLFETLEKQFTFKGINGYRYNSSLIRVGE